METEKEIGRDREREIKRRKTNERSNIKKIKLWTCLGVSWLQAFALNNNTKSSKKHILLKPYSAGF